MLRVFVRQLFPIQTNRLKINLIASLHCRYCTSTDGVDNANETAEKKTISEKYDEKSINLIKKWFKCKSFDAEIIYDRIEPLDLKLLNRKLTFLTQHGATLPVLMEHCYVLNLSTADLIYKFKLLRCLPWKKTDDFIPLLAAKKSKLKAKKIRDLSERIYYLSENLNIDATVVSMYVSKHSFMWQIDFDLIKTKLELLMKYDEYLAPINILRDLDIFLRSDDSILERFKRVTSTGVVKKAMPWMVKCPEPTLKRTIEIQEDRGVILNYLAKRLDWSIATINEMFKVFPKLRTFSGKYKNVEQVLNILLPQYAAGDITDNIRVVLMKSKLVERRCREIELAGVPKDFTTLKFMCRTRNKFVAYLREKGKRNEAAMAMNNEDPTDEKS